MNKEVIKANKDCFDYWLDGGKVWTKPNVPNGEWHIITTPTFEKDYKYVQDDKYSDLRKAQVDGKVIQYTNSNHETKDLEDWDNVSFRQFKGDVGSYSIKPDEPKFNVGDWVVYGNNIQIIKAIREYEGLELNCLTIVNSRDCELWQPQEGEVVCVRDNKSQMWMINENYCKETDEWKYTMPLDFITTLKDK